MTGPRNQQESHFSWQDKVLDNTEGDVCRVGTS